MITLKYSTYIQNYKNRSIREPQKTEMQSNYIRQVLIKNFIIKIAVWTSGLQMLIADQKN